MMQANPAALRHSLRQEARRRRRALSVVERRQAARAIQRHLSRAGWIKPGRRIAAYLATPEEIDCGPIIESALRRHCPVYLPRITDYRQRQMRFAPLRSRYRRNRFGILEPVDPKHLSARHLHVILVPLVAFDAKGHRLGAGAGYYDRALKSRLRLRHVSYPRLVGIAHSCQRVPDLPVWPTDVPLDAVVTERGIEWFTAHRRSQSQDMTPEPAGVMR